MRWIGTGRVPLRMGRRESGTPVTPRRTRKSDGKFSNSGDRKCAALASERIRRPATSDSFLIDRWHFLRSFYLPCYFFLLGPLGKHCLLLSSMTSSAWSTKSGIETRIQLLFNYSKDFDQFVNGLGRKPDPLNKFRAINNKL